jgi:DNA-binding NtrC family response regulator
VYEGVLVTSEPPHLLIVDDESDMLDFLERVLRRKYRVTRCDSAAQARKALQNQHFDAVLSDQKMPRETGLELLRHARDTRPTVARVLISGFTEVEDVNQAMREGLLDQYIIKPVDSRSVLDAVDQVLARRR